MLSNSGGVQSVIAEELRLNKGPQTDFDAVFASTYYPSEQNTELVNKGLIREAKLKNQLEHSDW